MKKFICCIAATLVITISFAQSTYDAKEAFSPQFYPYPGNEFRSASGEPGPKYWQNRADYKINCTLDTTKQSVTVMLKLITQITARMNLSFYGYNSIRIFTEKIPVPLPLQPKQVEDGPTQNSPKVMLSNR